MMIWDHFLVLLGLLSTLLGFFVTVFSFTQYRKGAMRLREREERLPDATLFEDLRRKIVDHQSKFDSLQEDLLNAREEIGRGQAVKGEHQQLSTQCLALRTELANLERDCSQRKHEAETEYGNLISKLQSERNLLQQDFDAEKKKVERQLEDYDSRMAAQLEQLKRDYATRQHTAESEIQEQIRQAEGQLSAVEEELKRKKHLVELELEEHRAELAGRLQELKQELSKQEGNVKLERQVQLQRTQQEFDESLLEMRMEHEKETSQIERERIQLENRIKHFRDERDELEKKHEELTKEVDEVESLHSELEISVKSLRSEQAQLEKTIPKLQQLWDRLLQQTGGGDDTSRTAELWQPVLRPGALAKPISERECLTNVEDYLESCGLSYSQRIVYAFHTALKVTEASPLVALAGISGTGKSELPRRYAEAVGMNFLPLAVQPRWDSPQDMFGFFNYLENRFRATELGRALVQMDPFHGETGRGWPSPLPKPYVDLSKQMLLVLLDEMNLARVEYYFSDFLSKLETRRGVDMADSEKRRKAELALEIGRTGIGSPVMHVFAGTNVLFVGTMNEDETTQTLSDKVIDRSNLIRFGCPKKLNVESNSVPKLKSSDRIAATTWQEWQQPISGTSSDRERIDEYIDRLNEAMSIVRRPFAHRTSRAIRAYVANYPRINEDSFNHAVADQIEQKLLPKFRGLDPSEPEVRDSLDKIRDIIDELEDMELLESVQASRVGHQFAWSGVDRAPRGQPV